MTDDHLSLDELAELDEGLLPPERISAVRAHLHGCEQCRARADAITSTRSRLADLPDVTMPAHVKARLDRVIAEQAQPTAEPAVETPEVEPVIDLSSRTTTITPKRGMVSRPRFGRPTMASSAAAAALVLAVGAIIVGSVLHHHGTGTSAGPGVSVSHGPLAANPDGSVVSKVQPHAYTTSSTGLDYTSANLTSNVGGLLTHVPSASASHGASGSGGTSTTGQGSAGGVGAPAPTTGGTTKSGRGSAPPVTPTSQLASSPAFTKLDTLTNQPVPAKLQPLYRSHAKQLACAASLADTADAVPVAIDFGRWTGGDSHHVPSAIFVFKAADPSNLAVFVTDPTCTNVLTYQLIANPA